MNRTRLSVVKFIKRVAQSNFTLESFTTVLVSIASAKLFSEKTLRSFTNFSAEQLNLEGQGEVAISEIPYPSRYQKVTEGKLVFYDKNFSKSSEFYYVEPGLYPSITDNVVEKNTLIQERHNHSESCIS